MFLRSTKYQLLIFAHFQRLPSWEPTSSPKERKSPRRTQKVDFTSTWLRSLRLVMFVSKTMIKVSSRPSHLNRVKHAEQSLFRQNWYNWASASLQYTANNTQAGVFTCMCVCVSPSPSPQMWRVWWTASYRCCWSWTQRSKKLSSRVCARNWSSSVKERDLPSGCNCESFSELFAYGSHTLVFLAATKS